MDAKILSSLRISALTILSVAVMAGCGFKSDLSLPGSEDRNPLFVPDARPEVQTAEEIARELAKPPALPEVPATDIEGDEIMLDRVTIEASDALILLNPGGTEEATTSGELVLPIIEDVQSEGVEVDLTVLQELEKKRNTQ